MWVIGGDRGVRVTRLLSVLKFQVQIFHLAGLK